jgi:hypothetical protein
MRKSAFVLFLLLFCLAFFVPSRTLEATSVESSAAQPKPPDMIADQGRPVGQYSTITCFVRDANGKPIQGVTVYFTVDPLAKSVFQTSVSDSDGKAVAEIRSAKAGSAFVYAYYQLPGDSQYTAKNVPVTFFPAPAPSITDDILNTIQNLGGRKPVPSGSGTLIPQINGAAPGTPRSSGSGTLNPQTSGAEPAIPSSSYDDYAGLFTGTYAVNVNTNSTNAYRPGAPAQNSQFSANVGVTDQGSDIVIDGYYKSVPIHLVSKVTRTQDSAKCALSFNLANKTISGDAILTFTMSGDNATLNGMGEGAYVRPYTPEKGADYHPGSGRVTGTRLSTALPDNVDTSHDGVGPVGDIPGPDNTAQAATGIIAPGLLTLVAAAAGGLGGDGGGPDASLPDGDGGGGDGGDGGDGGGDSGGGDTSDVPPITAPDAPTTDTTAPPVDTGTQPTVPPVSETPPAAGTTAAAAAVPPPAQPPTPPGPPDGTEKVWHDPVTGNDLVMLYNANLVTQSGDGTLQKGDWVWKDQPDKVVQDSMVANSDSVAAEKTQAIAEQAAVNATGADLKQTLDDINTKYKDQLTQEKYLDNLGDKAMTSTTLSDDNKQKVWNAIQQQQSNIEDGLSVDSSKLKAITSLVKDAYSGKTADESTLPAAYDGMSTLNVIKDTASNITNDAVQGTTDAAHAILTGKDRDGNISVMGIVARTGIDALTAGQAEWVMTPAGSLWKMSDQVWNAKPGVDESTFKIATREMGMVVLGQQVTWGLQSAGNQIGSSFVNNFPNAANNIVANVNPIAGQFAQSFTTKLGKAVIVEGIKKMFPK